MAPAAHARRLSGLGPSRPAAFALLVSLAPYECICGLTGTLGGEYGIFPAQLTAYNVMTLYSSANLLLDAGSDFTMYVYYTDTICAYLILVLALTAHARRLSGLLDLGPSRSAAFVRQPASGRWERLQHVRILYRYRMRLSDTRIGTRSPRAAPVRSWTFPLRCLRPPRPSRPP